MDEGKADANRDEAEATRPGRRSAADAGVGEGRSAAFGMWKDRRDMDDVDAWLRDARRGRFHDP